LFPGITCYTAALAAPNGKPACRCVMPMSEGLAVTTFAAMLVGLVLGKYEKG